MDSSDSFIYAGYEGSVFSSHFGCTCDHSLLVFKQFGDLEQAVLRSGHVYSSKEWRKVPEHLVARNRDRKLSRSLRSNLALVRPEIYEFLDAEEFRYYFHHPANEKL